MWFKYAAVLEIAYSTSRSEHSVAAEIVTFSYFALTASFSVCVSVDRLSLFLFQVKYFMELIPSLIVLEWGHGLGFVHAITVMRN